LAIYDHEEVPLLRGAKVAGEFEGFVVEDVASINARLDDEPGQEADEAAVLILGPARSLRGPGGGVDGTVG
jgi:hypothetical protein